MAGFFFYETFELDDNAPDYELEYTQLFLRLKRELPISDYEMIKNLQHEHDKVNLLWDFVTTRNMLPDTAILEEEKSDIKSEKIRILGNSHFIASQWKKALTVYNMSLCFAVSKEHQSIALANRSAVLFKMKMYNECLESIRLAREYGFPERLQEKLRLREAMCMKKMENAMEAKEVFVPEIGMPVSEKMPFMAKCLALGYNENFGNNLITKEDIPAGTIIAIKEPFSKALNNKNKYLRCAMCMIEVPHLLLPCDTCTQMMFCSKKCMDGAFDEFHAIDCPISGSLFKIFDVFHLIAFRTIIKAFLGFPDTEQMALALQRFDQDQKSVFSFDWRQKLSGEDLYEPIHNMITNMQYEREKYPLGKCIATCLIFNLLKNNCPKFRQSYLNTEKAANFFKSFVYKHLHTIGLKSNGLGSIKENRDIPGEGFGYTVCGFNGLFEHSCASNTQGFYIGSKLGIFANTNIAAGEQLFTTFGAHHTNSKRVERQRELMVQHQFHCQCRACVENFPLYDDLPEPRNIPGIPFDIFNEPNFSFHFNKKMLQTVINYIRQYGHLYPIRQIYDAQKNLFFCINALCGNITLKDD